MKNIRQSIFVLIVLVYIPCDILAQDQRIPVSENLLNNGVEYKINKKPSSSNIQKKKWKKPYPVFGSYTIFNWSKDAAEMKSRRNFWGTKFQDSEYKEWAFDLFTPGLDTLEVDIAYNFSSNEKASLQVLNIPVSFGEDELLSQKLNIAMSIQFQNAQDEPWMLFLSSSEGTKEYNVYKWLFVKGDRQIVVLPVKSKGTNNMMMLKTNSRGYTFTENGKEIAAVQSFSGNMSKPNEKFVWFDSSLDADFQMTLSGAMSTLLLLEEDANYIEATGQGISFGQN